MTDTSNIPVLDGNQIVSGCCHAPLDISREVSDMVYYGARNLRTTAIGNPRLSVRYIQGSEVPSESSDFLIECSECGNELSADVNED